MLRSNPKRCGAAPERTHACAVVREVGGLRVQSCLGEPVINAHNRAMTSPAQLQDAALLQRCHFWRVSAIQGVRAARRHAQAYEAELARRLCIDDLPWNPSEWRPL